MTFVLVVDDDSAMLRTLTINLRARDYDVETAAASELHPDQRHQPPLWRTQRRPSATPDLAGPCEPGSVEQASGRQWAITREGSIRPFLSRVTNHPRRRTPPDRRTRGDVPQGIVTRSATSTGCR
jgi:hypothetical protein